MDRLRFSATVLLPVMLALLLTAVAMTGFVLWATNSIDARAHERQRNMLGLLIENQRTGMLNEQESTAIWDEAVIFTDMVPSPGWIDTNIGQRMYRLFHHSQVMVLDGSDQPLYLLSHGEVQEPDAYRNTFEPSIGPLLAGLRESLVAGGIADWRAGRRDDLPSFSTFALIGGTPSIVAASPIVSSTGSMASYKGQEPILVSVLNLDQRAAQYLSRNYLFSNAEFVQHPSTDNARAAYPIINADGRFIAFLEWNRDRPGHMMLSRTGPMLLAGFVGASILVLLLMTQLRRSNAAIEAGRQAAEFQAAHDRLTGLPNRMAFDRYLAQTLISRAASGSRVDLMMLDLDRFKQVNDTLGHQAGDELICRVTERIRRVAGPDIFLARIGGDEFALLIAGGDSKADALALSNSIIAAIGEPYTIRQFQAFVGASIGIARTVGGDADARELVRRADIALYEAKADGRNRAVVFEEHMNELLQVQHTIEAELREALRLREQLWVAFQPLVDQQSQRVVGAEALVRWHHPRLGQISPARFVPVAESTGLIEALGECVLRQACQLGAEHPGFTMAVNISPTQLRNPQFAQTVFDVLAETGMRHDDLELEITESILLDDEHISAENLRIFRQAGVHVALDDFGTGYSSLSYLKRYPVDRIKIDRSFVSQLAQGQASVAITRALVTLAHAMSMHVTAEGVETEEQATILAELGCNTLQGFLFSPAVERTRIEAIFAAPGALQPRPRRSAIVA